jgi:Kef-type K+ transport system membrane component KefB
MKLFLLLTLAGFMHAALSFTEGGQLASQGTALAFGFLIISAVLAGRLFQDVRLPRLTGYLVVGIVVGPQVLGLLTQPMVDSLSLVNGVAIGLIALSAGVEIHLPTVRPLLRVLLSITGLAVGGTILLLAAGCLALRGWLPFLASLPFAQAVTVSVVLGVVMVAQSPAVVVALRQETAADGIVMRTVLAVVVLADLVVIVLFAITSSVAKAAFGGEGALSGAIGMLAWKVFGSAAVGGVIGALIGAFLRRIQGGAALFILTACVIVAEVGTRLELDPLLTLLVAGLLVRNVTGQHEALTGAIGASALPVYALFFAVAGARIHLSHGIQVLIPLVILWIMRGVGLTGGTWLAVRAVQGPREVSRYAGWGLIPQAGLALALATLFSDLFPEYGSQAAAVTMGLVALNEIVGPVLFRSALSRSGEVGARTISPP